MGVDHEQRNRRRRARRVSGVKGSTGAPKGGAGGSSAHPRVRASLALVTTSSHLADSVFGVIEMDADAARADPVVIRASPVGNESSPGGSAGADAPRARRLGAACASDPLGSRRQHATGRLSGKNIVIRPSRTLHHRESLAFRGVVVALGRSVRSLRRERRWTIEVAAERFGIEPAYVRSVEGGRTNPSLAVIVSIAAAFGMRAGELLLVVARAAPEPRR